MKSRIRDFRGALTSDPRRPVLFLRSFSEDRRAVWRPYSPSIVETFAFRSTFAEFLCRALESVGPVIAIAEPGSTHQTIGVAQQSLTNDEWQAKALDLMERAQVIVLLAGRTGGIKWELEQLLAHRHLAKTIVLLPRAAGPHSLEAWWSLCDAFEDGGYAPLSEEVDIQTLVALLPSIVGQSIVLTAKRASAPRRYELAVRAALKLVRAEERPVAAQFDAARPRKARRRVRLALVGPLVVAGAALASLSLLAAAPAFQRSTPAPSGPAPAASAPTAAPAASGPTPLESQLEASIDKAFSDRRVPVVAAVTCPHQSAPLSEGSVFACSVTLTDVATSQSARGYVRVSIRRGQSLWRLFLSRS